MSDVVQQTELDKAINTPYVNMLKAAVPYVESPTKNTLAAFAKGLELINTQKMLSEPEIVEACSLHKGSTDTVDMLRAIKHVGHGKDILLIDIMIHLFTVNKLILKYREFEGPREELKREELHELKREIKDRPEALLKGGPREKNFREERKEIREDIRESRGRKEYGERRERGKFVEASSSRQYDEEIEYQEETLNNNSKNENNNNAPMFDINMLQSLQAMMGNNQSGNGSSNNKSNQSSNEPGIDNNMIESLKTMLTPEQRQTFNMLSQMMNNNS